MSGIVRKTRIVTCFGIHGRKQNPNETEPQTIERARYSRDVEWILMGMNEQIVSSRQRAEVS